MPATRLRTLHGLASLITLQPWVEGTIIIHSLRDENDEA